jgi:hypothetical protein
MSSRINNNSNDYFGSLKSLQSINNNNNKSLNNNNNKSINTNNNNNIKSHS